MKALSPQNVIEFSKIISQRKKQLIEINQDIEKLVNIKKTLLREKGEIETQIVNFSKNNTNPHHDFY